MKTLLTIILFTVSLQVNATIRYVSHEGSNTPPYTTWETAADSIMFAINISVFGDTIYVANGVYKEQVIMIPGLTLIGTGADSTIIDTREFQLTSEFFTVEVVDSCIISNFAIFTYNVNQGNGIIIESGINSVVTNCRIKEAHNGIVIFSGTQNKPIVKKNVILQVNDGIMTFFAQSIISENIINPRGHGLVSQLNAKPTYINNTIVCEPCNQGYHDFGLLSKLKNNNFYRISGGDYGLWTYGDTIISNNIYGGWGRGITGAGSVIKNTHIEKTLTGLNYDVGGGSPPVFQFNNLWQNQANFQNFTPDSTNIFVNPMFVNEDSLDFHLQMYSPLIDAGDPNILDIDGSRSDIGLFGGPFGESYKYIDLAPKPPRNLSAIVDSEYITISWNPNTESDFSSYNLFRDTTANFTVDSTTFVIELTETFYQHIIPPQIDAFYYKLTATDNQGNESGPSEELAVIITSVNDFPATVSNYQLYQNYPNPFNPSTKIAYKLKERGYVKLYVYDIKGELISVLVNQTQDAGYYEVEFSAGVGTGLRPVLASGIYIYQIMIKSENNPSKPGPNGIPVFTDMKKMLLIK